MNTISKSNHWPRRIRMSALCGLTLFLGAVVMANEPDSIAEKRVSESKYYADDGRNQQSPNRVSTDEFDAFAAGEKNVNRNTKTRGGLQKSSAAAKTPNTDFWIYTADVELFGDEDRDGYYHGIDLYFDADTVFVHADVYAVVYLSLDGGPWTEYAETETFSIFGANSGDDYVIVSELLAGYPSGDYDILIELFDTFDNSFVADFGPENSSELAFLPLEDSERDLPLSSSPTVVVNRGGGGAADWLSIAGLGLVVVGVAALRRRRRPLFAQAQ